MLAAESLFNMVVAPIGFGLLGLAEPCSIGSGLSFIKAVEGRSTATKIMQALVDELAAATLEADKVLVF